MTFSYCECGRSSAVAILVCVRYLHISQGTPVRSRGTARCSWPVHLKHSIRRAASTSLQCTPYRRAASISLQYTPIRCAASISLQYTPIRRAACTSLQCTPNSKDKMAVLRVPTYNVLPIVVLRVPAYNVLPTKGTYCTNCASPCLRAVPRYDHIKF